MSRPVRVLVKDGWYHATSRGNERKAISRGDGDCAHFREILGGFRNGSGKEDIMKKVNNREMEDDLRPEYDLSKLKGKVRGKYAKRFQQGTNVILLSPDVARYFPDERSVNSVLRSLVWFAKNELSHTR